MGKEIEIRGNCDPKFKRVKSVFKDHFERGLEIGAAVAAYVEGRRVIDLWAGYADRSRTRLWRRNTLVNVFSTTKGATAACIHRLVDRGVLDLDDRVAAHWPEFAQNGKSEITIRMLLSHRAGLPAVDVSLPPEALFDWRMMTDALARQEPLWPPDSRHGYHARTYGWLLGEVIRRVAGKSPGTYFREEIAGPLGLDFYIGLPDSQHDRVAFVTPMPPPPPDAQPRLSDIMRDEPDSFTAKAFLNPPSFKIRHLPNTPEFRRAEIPSSNGHATAAAVARFYAALACNGNLDGVRILSPESVQRAATEHSRGVDAVLRVETRFGLGFMLPTALAPMGPHGGAFGHPGMGGSLGFADPEAQVGFGYVMNSSGTSILIDARPAALIEALYASI